MDTNPWTLLFTWSEINRLAVGWSVRAQQTHKVINRTNQLIRHWQIKLQQDRRTQYQLSKIWHQPESDNYSFTRRSLKTVVIVVKEIGMFTQADLPSWILLLMGYPCYHSWDLTFITLQEILGSLSFVHFLKASLLIYYYLTKILHTYTPLPL